MRKNWSLLSAAVLSLLAATAQAQVQADAGVRAEAAESPKTDSGDGIDEVVVTAQRRAERLQDVPIAISALGGDALANIGATDLSKIQGTVPSLTISTFAGFNASNLIGLRGVTGLQLPIGTGQATAAYLDGVYLSRPDAAFFALDDIERIEVLRGPQGTLYGRNATAGAINIITRNPGEELRGGVNLSYGNYDALSARASLSGPITSGLSAGISGGYDRHDGYSTNVTTGNRFGRRESYTLRGKLRFVTPNEKFSAVLSSDVSHVSGQDVFKNAYVGTVLAGFAPYDEIRSDAATEAVAEIGTRLSGVSLTMDFKAGDTTVTSITSYRHFQNETLGEADGGNLLPLVAATKNSSNTFNQELRAVLSAGNLRATIGANHFHESADLGFSIQSVALPLNRASPKVRSRLDATALFSQVEYDLGDRWTAVAGLRFNTEQRDYVVDYTGGLVPGRITNGKVSDDALIPSFGINYQPTSEVLLYAKASQGYQAPGFNYAPGPAAVPNTFRAEKLWAYETGAKTQFLDRRVTLNLAAFYYDYSDLQARLVTSQTTTSVENAASATIRGLEGELMVRPARGLTLSGQVTYIDATYGKFCETLSAGTLLLGDPACVTAAGSAGGDRSGNQMTLAPKWSGGVSANYVVPLGAVSDLAFNVGYSFQSNSFFRLC